MSIESLYGKYTPICDCCGETLEEERSFQAAVDAKKAASWRSVKEKRGWQDYCPKCAGSLTWEE